LKTTTEKKLTTKAHPVYYYYEDTGYPQHVQEHVVMSDGSRYPVERKWEGNQNEGSYDRPGELRT